MTTVLDLQQPFAVQQNVETADPSLENCSICLEPLAENLRTLECSHVYHKPCIETALRISELCPLCRAPSFPIRSIDSSRLSEIHIEHSDFVAVQQQPLSNRNLVCGIVTCYMFFMTSVCGAISLASIMGDVCDAGDIPCNERFDTLHMASSVAYSVSVVATISYCAYIIRARIRA